MEVIKKTDYLQARFFVDAHLDTDLENIVFAYKNPDLFESFEERLICFLIAESSLDGQTYGRSQEVIDNLLFSEYYNSDEETKINIEKRVKKALHNLYRARFIRRDNQEHVYLCSNIDIHRKIGHSPNVIELEITSYYEDGIFSITEYNDLYCGEDFNNKRFSEALTCIPARDISPYAAYLLKAQRLGEHASPTDFERKDIYEDLINAGWMCENKGKVALSGNFKVIGNEDDNSFRVIYSI